jgi:hypothetical protein
MIITCVPILYNYVVQTGVLVFLIISFAFLKLPLVYMMHLLVFLNLLIDQSYLCSVANVYLYVFSQDGNALQQSFL